MAATKVSCGGCNSEYTISSSMDKKHYTPAYCVYCGDSLDNDVEPDLDFSDLESDE